MSAASLRLPIDVAARWLDLANGDPAALVEEVRGFLSPKLSVPEPVVKRPVVAVSTFVALAKAALGDLVVTPTTLTPGWYAKMTRLLRQGGVEDRDAAAMLVTHVAGWAQYNISIDMLAAKSGEWLAMARARQKSANTGQGARPTYGGAREMEIE